MKKNVLKYVSIIMTPILVLILIACISIKDIPENIYTNNEMQVISSLKQDVSVLTDVQYNNSKAKLNFLGILPMKSVCIRKIDDIEVIPGGESIGIKLSSDGVLVVGHSDVMVNNEKKESPAKKAGVQIGDIIIKVNGQKIYTSKELIDKVRSSKDSKLDVEINRDGENIKKVITLIEEKNEGYKIGLWVRDSTAGVGTLTFYEKKSGNFGALGHPVTDSETNKPFTIKEGDLLKSTVISVKRGEKGNPGELRGIFQDEEKVLGKIDKNTQCGIFGEGNKETSEYTKKQAMHVACRDEIKIGKASILTTIDEEGVKEYEIEIIKLFEQDEPGPKSMIIKITDKNLLEKTGGIVQGMSGSPIIQNGKIIGAVTHVLINKPDVGYGIYIDWMLQDIEILR